jgi:Ni/Fe-hydrogenase 1 B-type cytochrome subunit
MKSLNLRRVYVWELPVRVYHWLNALTIVVLCITGYIIANPPAIQFGGEASFRYWFGINRFIHFAAAYIFFFNFLFRIYWGFVGNKYANWKNFIPTSKRFLHEMWLVLKIDILLQKEKEHMAVGHNALAGFIYFLTFLAFLIQCVTGFGLYASMSDAWLPSLFAWVPGLVGGDIALRMIHHIAMWFFILFTIVHVYLVFYHDYVEGRGEISSMGGGWKFIEEDTFQKELEEEEEELEKLKQEAKEQLMKEGV